MSDRALDPTQAAQRKLRALLRRDGALDPKQAQALEEASALLQEARRALQATQGHVEALRAQARQEATQEIYREMNHLLLRAQAQQQALLERAEPQLIALALELARRMLGQALEQDPALVAQMARQALRRVQGQGRVQLRVHPEDLAFVEEALADLEEVAQSRISLQPDPEVPPGGCCIDTEASLIEVNLDLQVQALAQALGQGPAKAPP